MPVERGAWSASVVGRRPQVEAQEAGTAGTTVAEVMAEPAAPEDPKVRAARTPKAHDRPFAPVWNNGMVRRQHV
ncbi:MULTISPECIES: hypothetical protein [unclassified Streptomyces]|uniref:hypothetical protein n=1 Tax=unclassified Streptomyces TaxID=2593676 RepID=UPI0029AFE33E|nr:hypothetical protein [Streptomyces sp. DK15]MDX2394864.1 hypothetical protein [Streptomyces sp. DK15]